MGIVKKEEIRAAINDMSREALADALTLFFVQGNKPEQAVAGMDKPELANFAQALQYLKKNYDFEELDFFSTEADLVYVKTGGRRVLLTDRMNVVSGSAGEKKQEDLLSGLGVGATVNEDASPEAPERSGGRFSNLEM